MSAAADGKARSARRRAIDWGESRRICEETGHERGGHGKAQRASALADTLPAGVTTNLQGGQP